MFLKQISLNGNYCIILIGPFKSNAELRRSHKIQLVATNKNIRTYYFCSTHLFQFLLLRCFLLSTIAFTSADSISNQHI